VIRSHDDTAIIAVFFFVVFVINVMPAFTPPDVGGAAVRRVCDPDLDSLIADVYGRDLGWTPTEQPATGC